MPPEDVNCLLPIVVSHTNALILQTEYFGLKAISDVHEVKSLAPESFRVVNIDDVCVVWTLVLNVHKSPESYLKVKAGTLGGL